MPLGSIIAGAAVKRAVGGIGGFLISRTGIAALGIGAAVLAFNVGQSIGHRSGETEGRLAERLAFEEANRQIADEIRRDIENALRETGSADLSDDDVDGILRRLSGAGGQ